MTVLIEPYWEEISAGLAQHGLSIRHFVLHADQATLRQRIEGEHVIPSPFRLSHLEAYAEAARTWLPAAADTVDTTNLTHEQVVQHILDRLSPTTGEQPIL